MSLDPTAMTTMISTGAAEDLITITSGGTGPQHGYYTSTSLWETASDLTLGGSNKLDLHGEDADIRINGVSLTETLQGIQDRLAMLRPNPELESRWQQLRDLRDQYQTLERELQEKEQAWAALQQHG